MTLVVSTRHTWLSTTWSLSRDISNVTNTRGSYYYAYTTCTCIYHIHIYHVTHTSWSTPRVKSHVTPLNHRSTSQGTGRDWKTDVHGHGHVESCWQCHGTGRKRSITGCLRILLLLLLLLLLFFGFVSCTTWYSSRIVYYTPYSVQCIHSIVYIWFKCVCQNYLYCYGP